MSDFYYEGHDGKKQLGKVSKSLCS